MKETFEVSLFFYLQANTAGLFSSTVMSCNRLTNMGPSIRDDISCSLARFGGVGARGTGGAGLCGSSISTGDGGRGGTMEVSRRADATASAARRASSAAEAAALAAAASALADASDSCTAA